MCYLAMPPYIKEEPCPLSLSIFSISRYRKKVLFTSDDFSIPAFTAITREPTKLFGSAAFNRCMRFTLGMTVKSGRLAASGSLLL
jgi:hypothetical protein